jgi:hypothetical protein
MRARFEGASHPLRQFPNSKGDDMGLPVLPVAATDVATVDDVDDVDGIDVSTSR